MSIRKHAPAIAQIQSLVLPVPNRYTLDNQIPVYEIALGTQPILRIELVFKAGRWYEPSPLTARAAARMLKLGTLQHDAESVADYFDFYGTKLNIEDDFDTVSVTLYCLSKHLEPLLAMLQEVFLQPAFPEDEFEKFIRREKQRLKSKLQENDVVAYRTLTESLFGKTHPYGYNSTEAHYDALNIVELKKYFHQYFAADRCTIMVAGKTDAQTIPLLNRYLGALSQGIIQLEKPVIPAYPDYVPEKIHLPSPKQPSLQASLRLGRRLFPRTHPDFHKISILNTVLGGYFGARLMQNLREENGYTYGIYSSIETLNNDTHWCISTEVGNEVKEASLIEIYSEIERLKEEPIGKEELDMLRSYSLGMMLNALDGAFKIATIWRELLSADLPPSFFTDYINTLHSITPAELQDIAQKYMTGWCEVVVG